MNNLNFIGSNVLFKLIFKQVFGLKSIFSSTNYAKVICKLGRKLFFNYNFAMQILASFFFSIQRLLIQTISGKFSS